MRLRLLLPLAIATTALLACGPSKDVLDDRDSGPDQPDAGPIEPDAGPIEPDGGLDAGPPPDGGPSCVDEEPLPTDPTAGEWDTSFSLPGVGGTSPSAAIALASGPDGAIYVGGQFSHAGSTEAKNIVKYTAEGGWEPLGAGIDGEVSAIAVHPSGAPIYAAAQMHDGFESAVLVFDGTSWTELARTEDGFVNDMALDADGKLYIGGWFASVDGDGSLSHFAVWDGASWSGLGDGAPDGEVLALLSDAHGVCIGGRFASVGTTSATNVACWESGAWEAYDLADIGNAVHVLARDPGGALVAGGRFPQSPEQVTEGGSIARWNGSDWEVIGGGVHSDGVGPGLVEGIAFKGSDMYVAGRFVAVGPDTGVLLVSDVARWDGSAWHDVGGGAYRARGFGIQTDNVKDMLAVGSRIYIAGKFSAVGTQSASHVAVWDGTYWSALRGPGRLDGGVNGNVMAFAARGDCGVYVGGTFLYAGDVVARNVAHFDGSRWHAMGDGLDGSVNALAVAPDGTVYAGGDFIGPGFYHLARWDGTRWSAVGGNVMAPVTALAIDDEGRLYVSGEFEVAGDIRANRIAIWDGSEWHALGEGLDAPARAIAFTPEGHVVVGGAFQKAGGVSAMRVARWDGSEWSAYGEGLPGYESVRSIAFYGGELVVAGRFDPLPDGGAGVAVWDGTQFVALGGGLYSQYEWSLPDVYGLAVVGTHLFAVGEFSVAPGEIPVRAAYFDGTSWTAMGTGLNDAAEAILATPEGVFFGGAFTKADDKPSVGIAHWRFDP